jgi:hypothetical protein
VGVCTVAEVDEEISLLSGVILEGGLFIKLHLFSLGGIFLLSPSPLE